MCEAEPRFCIDIRGLGPSDFQLKAEGPGKRDEAVALANDIHDLLQEEYGKLGVTGVVPVVNPEVHEGLVSRC